MQDEIVSRLANTLKGELIAVEARRAQRSIHPDVMDLNFQGQACIYKGITAKNLSTARSFFERALAVDTRNVAALVGMAMVDLLTAAGLLSEDRIARFSAAEEMANQALSIYPNHATAHSVLGGVYIYTGRVAQGVSDAKRRCGSITTLPMLMAILVWLNTIWVGPPRLKAMSLKPFAYLPATSYLLVGEFCGDSQVATRSRRRSRSLAATNHRG